MALTLSFDSYLLSRNEETSSSGLSYSLDLRLLELYSKMTLFTFNYLDKLFPYCFLHDESISLIFASNGMFTVGIDGTIEQIIVIDALGRSIELPTDNVAGTVYGLSLSSGKYIVKVTTSAKVYTKELVILK